MQEKINVINGQGLDILEEAGIHICEKKKRRCSPVLEIIKNRIEHFRKNASDYGTPEEWFNLIFSPVEDIIKLAEKLEGQDGSAKEFHMLLLTIATGYLLNPTFLSLLLADARELSIVMADVNPDKALAETLSRIKESKAKIKSYCEK